jgi:hypothetical protein
MQVTDKAKSGWELEVFSFCVPFRLKYKKADTLMGICFSGTLEGTR